MVIIDGNCENARQFMRLWSNANVVPRSALRCRSAPYFRCVSSVASVPSTGRNNIAEDASGAPNMPKVAVLTPLKLAEHFRPKFYEAPTGQQHNVAQRCFNSTHFRLESVVGNQNDIPIKKSLPEVLFLGHTNVGKSSLIESVMAGDAPGGQKNKTDLPKSGKNHGFTKTLNFYNIGNKFRLVDSPGYGQFGLEDHGDMVLHYIESAPNLRRAFVLIDGLAGVRPQDAHLITFLVDHGIPFEIVLTKTDLVVAKYSKSMNSKAAKAQPKQKHDYASINTMIIKHYNSIIKNNGLDSLGFTPRLLFSNCSKSVALKHKYGYKEVRIVIMQSCNLLES